MIQKLKNKIINVTHFIINVPITFYSLEEVMERELMCSFLTLAIEFFATSHSTLNHSGNFGSSLPVGIIIIYVANGSVDVLKNSVTCFVEMGLMASNQRMHHHHHHSGLSSAKLLHVGLKQFLQIGLIYNLKSNSPGHVNGSMP
jgi:hypothetical protein